MKPVIAIVQARQTSTRLPGKALVEVAPGVSMLQFVLQRLRLAARVDATCVAYPKGQEEVRNEAVKVTPFSFAGDEADVLGRFYDAARACSAKTVVRITADCPLVDPGVVDSCIDLFRAGTRDYLSNCHPERTLPSGFDVEVFSFDALRDAHFACGLDAHREHVTTHFYDCGGVCGRHYRLAPWRPNKPWPGPMPHLSVDTPAHLDLVRRIVARLGKGDAGYSFGWRDVADAWKYEATVA